MSEEHSDSPPTHPIEQEEHAEHAAHTEHEIHAEHEAHAEEADLIHAELGEAVAATRKPPAPAMPRRGKPRAKVQALGFLRMEQLPTDLGSGNGPVAAWIILQLAAIAAAAGRWKFWTAAGVGAAPSIELLALDTLLVVQLIVGTLIYPILLDSWTKLAWSVATVIAFDAIAWVMTDVPPAAAVWAGAFVVAWLMGLAVWRRAVRGPFATMLLRLALALVVLGWPIVMYLHGEFGGNSTGSFAGTGGGGPIVIGVEQLASRGLIRETWIAAAALLGSGAMVWLAKWGVRRRPTRAALHKNPAVA